MKRIFSLLSIFLLTASAPVFAQSYLSAISHKQAAVTAQNITADGAGTAVDVTGFSQVLVTIRGTYVLVDMAFEASPDGTNYFSVPARRVLTGAFQTSSGALTDTTRSWRFNVAGMTRFRHNTNWTSGTASVTITPIAAPTDTGVITCLRDDALSALSELEGTHVPCRVDGNGAMWFNLSTALDSAVDSITTVGNSGANGNAQINCDANTFLNMTTATTTEIVALSGATHIYVCSYSIVSEGDIVTTVKFVSGTGTNCATSQEDRSSGKILTAGSTTGIARGSGEGMILKTGAAGDALCVTQSGAANLGIDISYARF